MNDLHEIALRVHHGINVLVSRRRLIDDLLVLSAFDTSGRRHVIVDRETTPRLATRHGASRAVTTAIEALRVAETAHDIRTRAHAARNDPKLALTGAHGTLSRHENVLTEVILARDVVVMTIDRLHMRLKRLRNRLAHREHYILHHDFAILPCKVLRPLDRLDVVVEVFGAFWEVSKILIGKVNHPGPHILLRKFYEVRADRIPHAARTAVKHEPHRVRLIETYLDEVIAGTERSQV